MPLAFDVLHPASRRAVQLSWPEAGTRWETPWSALVLQVLQAQQVLRAQQVLPALQALWHWLAPDAPQRSLVAAVRRPRPEPGRKAPRGKSFPERR